jgi:hypothetical protein
VSHRTVSGAHRTVRCDSGATATSRQRSPAEAFNARQRAQRSRARAGGTSDNLQGLSDAPPDSQAGPQDRAQQSNPNGLLTWLAHRTVSGGAPDCPVRHATAAFQRPLCGGWGYKYPNHPTFMASKFSTFQLLTRALAFNSRHTKMIKLSPIPHKVISERDLLCSFELLRLDCFLLSFFLANNSIVIEARDTNCVVVLAGEVWFPID